MTQMHINLLVAFLTGVVGPIVVMLVREWLEKKKAKKDPIREELEVATAITDRLEEILHNMKCDRAWLVQFHNGGHFYPTGKSIKKFSIFYERTTDRTASIKDTFQNIPVSLFPKAFSLIYKDGEIVVPNTSENTVDCGLFQVNGKDYKTKSFYVFSIKDINNNFIGSLTISYYEKEHHFTQEEWILIRQKIGAIGAILTDYLHGKR